jgi:hypothetical protein
MSFARLSPGAFQKTILLQSFYEFNNISNAPEPRTSPKPGGVHSTV